MHFYDRSKLAGCLLAGLFFAGLAGCENAPSSAQVKPAFVPTPGLDRQRQRHAAAFFQTPAPDRQTARRGVLIVGGIDGPAGSLAFANVFDANAGAFRWAESIHPAAYGNIGVEELARLDLRVTPMKDGKILVTGGSVCVATTSNLSSICTPGDSECKYCDEEAQRKLRSSALLFDPLLFDPEKPYRNGWLKWGWATKPRSRHTVTTFPASVSPGAKTCAKQNTEMVYLLGGHGKNLQETAELIQYAPDCDEIFIPWPMVDLNTSAIEVIKPQGIDWSGHTATLLPDENLTSDKATILVVGRIQSSDKCEAFLVNPAIGMSGKWEGPLSPELSFPCQGHSAEVIGQKGKEMIAIVGGEIEKGKPLDQVLLFDPREKKFSSTVSHMRAPRSFATTGVLKSGDLIVAGGLLSQDTADGMTVLRGRRDVEQFVFESRTSKSLPDMKCARLHHTMTKLSPPTEASSAEHFLVVGGTGDDLEPSCKALGNSGNSGEVLYINDSCATHADCSPDYDCIKPNCSPRGK